MSQLRQKRGRLSELKIVAKIVAFDDHSMAKAYADETDLDWPILFDRDRKLYAAYGMEKGSYWNIYNPIAMVRYIGLFLRGAKIGKPGSDWFQLGGDILIDPHGFIRMHHVSKDPLDRPSPKLIFNTVESSNHVTDSHQPSS